MEIDSFFNAKDDNFENAFVRMAIKSVFDECLYQLYILRHLNIRNYDNFDPFVIQYQTLEERFTGREKFEDIRIPAVGTNADKVSKDISVFINIIKEASHEVNNYGTYEILKESINSLRKMINDELEIKINKENAENTFKMLVQQCKEEQDDDKNTIRQTNENIQKIRFEAEDSILYKKTELNFFKHYEATRREQNKQILDIKEQSYIDTINEVENKIELEMKCHKKFEAFIEEDREELLESISYWVNEYDSQTEIRDNSLLVLKANLEYTQDQLEKLTNLYNKKQNEIDKWMDYKAKKKAINERIELENWAIMKIQSWWRGTMCRKGIPPGRIAKLYGRSKSKSRKSRVYK